LGEHFQFGGGAGSSTITPVVVAATLLAAVLLLSLPRKYALAPVLVVTFLTPVGQQVLVGGFHFYVIRILIIAGFLRPGVLSSIIPIFRGRSTPIERTFYLWEFLHIVAYVLLWRESGALVAQCAAALDVYGGYILIRYFIQTEEDVLQTTKILSVVAGIVALCMCYESMTHVNVFSYINEHAIVPGLRDNGQVRAQAVFANSITAGVFGATLLPLFFWLVKGGQAKLWGLVGLAAATAITVTSVASTALTALLGGMLALCLWPIRKQMRSVRWAIALTVAGLALVMKAPVWFLLARIDFVGGHGWDRAYLVDQFMRHVGDWWLFGTKDNASWGSDTWDACNQFVAEGIGGGIVGVVLFIVILSRGFGMIGRARKRAAGDRRQEWFFWCLGAVLFAHVIAYLGIDYFDNIRVLWYVFLAMTSATAASRGIQALRPQNTTLEDTNDWLPVRVSASEMVLEARQEWFSQEARPSRGAGAAQAVDQ
jgi:hypothetical protein